jgi:predicted transcriptional regulator
MKKNILEVLKRRPMRLEDIKAIIRINEQVILKELWLLERKKKVICQNNWWKFIL